MLVRIEALHPTLDGRRPRLPQEVTHTERAAGQVVVRQGYMVPIPFTRHWVTVLGPPWPRCARGDHPC